MTGCFSEEIEHLIFSKEFESLVSSMQRFNVFKALGVPRRELSHSVFLAYVFDPHKPHGCGSSIASAFLRAAYREAKAHGCSQLQLLQVAFLDLDSAIVRRELGYIDILIDVPSSRAVFAIENKIEAGEQLDQLSRYQDFISRNFSLSRYSVRVLLFLTPMGWLPTTVNPGSNVPVIPISYRCVLDALDSGLRCCNNQTAAAFIENAIDHIREEIMLVGPDRDLIVKLLADEKYSAALARIYLCRPTLADILDEWTRRVTEFSRKEMRSDCEVGTYKYKEILTEIDTRLKKWTDRKLKFALKLYHRGFLQTEKGPIYEAPAFRILLNNGDYGQDRETYDKFAQHAASIVFPDYPQLAGWPGWRKVLLDEACDYPGDSYISGSFDLQTVDEAFSKFKDVVERLDPVVEAFSGKGKKPSPAG